MKASTSKKETLSFNLDSPKFNRAIYFLLLGLSIIFFIVLAFLKKHAVNLENLFAFNHCSFREATGLYCPGCGGTRAFLALLEGDIVKSFIYHPAVLYIAGGIFLFILSHSLNIIFPKKIEAFKIKPLFFYILIAIILIQWIVKLSTLFITGVYFF